MVNCGLWPHRRCLDWHAAGAPHQVELEIDVVIRTRWRNHRAHAGKAAAQASLERPDALPFEPVDRIAARMRLRDRRAGETLAPIVVVTMRTREVELALPAKERIATGFKKRPRALIDRDVDRKSPGLQSDIGCERQQLLALDHQR